MKKNIIDDQGHNQIWHTSEAMRIRTNRRCDYMISQMTKKNDLIKILEIGCGTGDISHLLSQKINASVLGTDICLPFIEKSRKEYSSPNLRYEVLDFNDPTSIARIIGNEKFDYIVGNGILHHLFYKLDESLTSINNLLNTEGKMIFLEPNILNPYCFFIFNFSFFRKLAKLDPEEMAFTKDYIAEKLTATDFKNIKIEYRDFLIPGTPPSLIRFLITLGNILEKMPIIKKTSQSTYITATKK